MDAGAQRPVRKTKGEKWHRCEARGRFVSRVLEAVVARRGPEARGDWMEAAR